VCTIKVRCIFVFFFFNSSLNRHAKGTAYSLILQYFWEWRWEYIIFIYLFIDKKRTNERIITFIKYHLRTKVPNNHIYIYIYIWGRRVKKTSRIYISLGYTSQQKQSCMTFIYLLSNECPGKTKDEEIYTH
jgi:hypothetical protein